MIDIIKEVNRLSGFNVKSGVDIISGQPVKLEDSNTITLYDLVGDVMGLALDDTKTFVLENVPTTKYQSGVERVLIDRPSGDLTPQSLFFSEINRGGKVSVAVDGGVFGLMDDGRGSPFATNVNYVLNGPVYANANGLVTADPGSDPEHVKIGTCWKTPTDGKLVINLKLS